MQQNVQVTVTDINEKPVIDSDSSASVDENMPTSTVVYEASGSDVDGDNISFSLGGTDAALLIDEDNGEVASTRQPIRIRPAMTSQSSQLMTAQRLWKPIFSLIQSVTERH